MSLFKRRRHSELDTARAEGDLQEVVVLALQQGNQRFDAGDYEAAIRMYGEAREAATELNFTSELVDCCAGLARSNAELGRHEIAAAMFRQARGLAIESDRIMTAGQLSLAAGAELRKLGRSLDAVEYYGAARTLFIQAGVEDYAVACTREAASAYHDLKNYTKAIGAFDDAREWWEDLGQITLAREADEQILRLRAESGRL